MANYNSKMEGVGNDSQTMWQEGVYECGMRLQSGAAGFLRLDRSGLRTTKTHDSGGSHYGRLESIYSPMLPIRTQLAAERQYDTMRRNALKAAKIFKWETESNKLLEIDRRLSHRFNYRAT